MARGDTVRVASGLGEAFIKQKLYKINCPKGKIVSEINRGSGVLVFRQLTALAARDPSTLPSWTHEDTSVHAQERDRSLVERRTRHLTAAVMRLHSLQVCLITRPQTWLFQRPSTLTHPLPSRAWWRAAIKGRGNDDNKGEAADSSQHTIYIYIYIYIYIVCIKVI